jgi:HEPN domain-containing protein
MPPERLPSDDPREWLNRARSSLAHARDRSGEIYLEDLCFDAQQAAEKAIKAVLLYLGVRFPYVHDLAELVTLIERTGHTIPSGARESGRLTRYALETRYPGLSEPLTEQEYLEAVAIAEAVVRWAGEVLR